MTKEIESISCQQIFDVDGVDVDGDISWLQQYDINSKDSEERKYALQDKKRLEAYYNNEWHFVGVQAVAEIRINGISQTISSGGLWGIESDSSDEYFDEIFEEEKEQLKDVLLQLGFTEKEIAQNEDLEK
jgi:hypothetical protein